MTVKSGPEDSWGKPVSPSSDKLHFKFSLSDGGTGSLFFRPEWKPLIGPDPLRYCALIGLGDCDHTNPMRLKPCQPIRAQYLEGIQTIRVHHSDCPTENQPWIPQECSALPPALLTTSLRRVGVRDVTSSFKWIKRRTTNIMTHIMMELEHFKISFNK